jgi:hypothetical protein
MNTQQSKNIKKQTGKAAKVMFVVSLLVIWGGGLAFCVYLYRFGKEFPAEMVGPERMQDAWRGIYAIIGVTAIISVIWLFAYRKYRSNETRFISMQSTEEQAMPHSILHDTLPLSLTGNMLYVNSGFSIRELNIEDIAWIHSYRSNWSGGGVYKNLLVCFYGYNGKRTKFAFAFGDIQSVYGIIDKIREKRPDIMVSRGRNPVGRISDEYKECKKRYKSILFLK